MFKIHFSDIAPTVLAKKLFETKNENKNNDLVNVTKSGLRDLENEIKKMSKDEKKNEKPDKILKIVKEILNFNTKNSVRRRITNFNTRPNA